MRDDPFRARPDDDPAHWEALGRYLSGESPPDEAARIRRWIAGDPDRARMVEEFEQALDRLAYEPDEVGVEAALRNAPGSTDEAERRAPLAGRRSVVPLPRVPTGRRLLAATAIVACVIAAGALLQFLVPFRPDPVRAPAAARTYATEVGEVRSVRLSDGTAVFLAPSTTLRVPAAYGERSRVVDLEGKALFEVDPDGGRPFTVRAGPAVAIDLGTRFSVSTDPAGTVRVAVTEGTVLLRRLEDTGPEVVLRGGDRGRYEAGGIVSAERGAVGDADLAWTRGELVFRDAPIERVATELRRWYGVELELADTTLAGRTLTASFHGEPRPRVLETLALALGAELRMRGDTAVLAPAAPDVHPAR